MEQHVLGGPVWPALFLAGSSCHPRFLHCGCIWVIEIWRYAYGNPATQLCTMCEELFMAGCFHYGQLTTLLFFYSGNTSSLQGALRA